MKLELMVKILKSEISKQDIKDIWKYSFDNWGVKQADKYVIDLYKSFDTIARYPRISKEYLNFSPKLRIYRHKHHLIIYNVNENDNIYILRILYKTMDIEEGIDNN